MNARIYDPLIGRFMTPDSLVEDLFFSPVLNRYTYVGNNPLSITDPTGRSWLSKLFREVPVLRAVVAIAVGVMFQQWQVIGLLTGTVGTVAGTVANAVVGGMASGYVSSGTLKGAIIGGLTAAAFAGVHHLKDGLGFPEQAANYSAGQHLASAGMHGAVGGMASVAQGGKFGSGFLAAGFADLSGAIDTKSFAGNVAVHAVAGGIGSVLGGGKFENGAITGAFGYLFNRALNMQLNGKQRTELICLDCGEDGMSWEVFTGTGDCTNDVNCIAMKDVGPLQPGSYYIVEHGGGRLGWLRDWGRSLLGYSPKGEWFELWSSTTNADFYTVNGVTRSQIRLHPIGPRGLSEGCVTVCGQYDILRHQLLSSPTSMVPGTNTKVYGTLTVTTPDDPRH